MVPQKILWRPVTGRGAGWNLVHDKTLIGYSRKNKTELKICSAINEVKSPEKTCKKSSVLFPKNQKATSPRNPLSKSILFLNQLQNT